MLMAREASDIRRSFLPFYRGARLRVPGVQGVQTWQTHLRRETVVLWSSFVFLHTLHTLHTFYKKVLYVVYIEYRVYEEESRCEALMAVPPARPAPHRFSAGMQVCRVCRCVGAPSDVGLRPVFPLGY